MAIKIQQTKSGKVAFIVGKEMASKLTDVFLSQGDELSEVAAPTIDKSFIADAIREGMAPFMRVLEDLKDRQDRSEYERRKVTAEPVQPLRLNKIVLSDSPTTSGYPRDPDAQRSMIGTLVMSLGESPALMWRKAYRILYDYCGYDATGDGKSKSSHGVSYLNNVFRDDKAIEMIAALREYHDGRK